MEITLAGSRDKRDTWQHYRVAMVENMQAALVERDRVRLMARNHPAGKPSDDQPDNATSLAQSCESFLTHSVTALHAGYSMGRSVRYLKTNLLPLLTEAAEKCGDWLKTVSVISCSIPSHGVSSPNGTSRKTRCFRK